MSPTNKAGFLAILLLLSNFFWSIIFYITGLDKLKGIYVIIYILAYAVPLIIYFKITKKDYIKVLSLNPLSIRNIMLIFLISIFIQPTLSLISLLSTLIAPNVVEKSMGLNMDMSIQQLLFSFAVCPAVFEELWFRGIIFSNYENVPIKKAAICVGLMFAFCHSSLQQFFYTFFMGVIFCFFVYMTKSIFSAILSHFVINGTQLALYYVAYINGLATNNRSISFIESLSNLVWPFLYSLPILLFFIYAFLVNNKSNISPAIINFEWILEYNPDPEFADKAVSKSFIILGLGYFLTYVLPLFIK